MPPDERMDDEQAERHTAYWLDLAQYDLDTARVMLDHGRYLYVGFMCHQVVEKALKGLVVSATRQVPPYTHALVKLAQLSGAFEELSAEDQALLDVLRPLNIEARYPAQKDALLRSLSAERCQALTEGAERLLTWINKKCDRRSSGTPE